MSVSIVLEIASNDVISFVIVLSNYKSDRGRAVYNSAPSILKILFCFLDKYNIIYFALVYLFLHSNNLYSLFHLHVIYNKGIPCYMLYITKKFRVTCYI